MAPDMTARRRKPVAGCGVLKRVWEGRGGIVPGDVTHLDFIKGAVIREPEGVNPGASGFSRFVPTIQVVLHPPALKPEPSQGRYTADRTWDCPDPGRIWGSRPSTQGQLKHQVS